MLLDLRNISLFGKSFDLDFGKLFGGKREEKGKQSDDTILEKYV